MPTPVNITTNDNGLHQPLEGQRFLFQDYWIDFFGGVVPGALFLLGCALATGPAAALLIDMVRGKMGAGLLDFMDRPLRLAGALPGVFATSLSFLLLGLADRKSTRLNSSHANISYAVFCL